MVPLSEAFSNPSLSPDEVYGDMSNQQEIDPIILKNKHVFSPFNYPQRSSFYFKISNIL